MTFKLRDMTHDDIRELVRNGVGTKLEDMIYEELKVQAESTARKVAKEIAERLSMTVETYRSAADFQTRIDLNFTMSSEPGHPIGKIVAVKNGTPVVAWQAENYESLVGKKIFG